MVRKSALEPPQVHSQQGALLLFCIVICGMVLNAVIHYWISINSKQYAASNTSLGFVRLSWVLMQAPCKVGNHALGLNRTWNSPQEGSRSTDCYFQRKNKIFHFKSFISFVLYLLQYIYIIQSLFRYFKDLKNKQRTLQSYYPPCQGSRNSAHTDKWCFRILLWDWNGFLCEHKLNSRVGM